MLLAARESFIAETVLSHPTKVELVRVSSPLVEAAREAGLVMGRTAADQVSHWTRLGRVVEATGVRTTAIHDVLDGHLELGPIPGP